MGIIRHVLAFEAPVDRVFSRFTDIPDVSKHFEELLEDARKLEDGKYEVLYRSLLGKTHPLTVTRTEIVPDRFVAWKVEEGKIPLTLSIGFENAGAQTFATFVLCYDPPGVRLGDVLSDMMKYPHKRLENGLRRLVDEVESS